MTAFSLSSSRNVIAGGKEKNTFLWNSITSDLHNFDSVLKRQDNKRMTYLNLKCSEVINICNMYK